MGKGTIVSGGSGGLYSVQLNYNRTEYLARIAKYTQRIADYTALITTKQDEIDKQYVGFSELVGNEYIDRKNVIQKLQFEKAILLIGKTSAEKNKNNLELNFPIDRTISAWCVDLTEDLTGEVGTIEIPGEIGNVNIQPGHNGNAEYDDDRDGQLLPMIVATPAQSFYNLCTFAGWQKWMPTYRYGTVTSVVDDVANVNLDAATSSVTGLNINQGTSLTNVDIEYMSCNGSAFSEDDEVVVKFENQDWASPKIIGFKSNPKICEFYINIQCNGVTPTVPKSITLYWTDAWGIKHSEGGTSTLEEPGKCGPFINARFPAIMTLDNIGAATDALHPDVNKKLFNFYCPNDYGNYIYSTVTDSSQIVNPGYYGKNLNIIKGDVDPGGGVLQVANLSSMRYPSEITSIPKSSDVFNFSGLKILRLRATTNSYVDSSINGPLCSCNFGTGDISNFPDPLLNEFDLKQPTKYFDTNQYFDIDLEVDTVSEGANCNLISYDCAASIEGYMHYIDSVIPSESLYIKTDIYGGNPTHTPVSFSYVFSGHITVYDFSFYVDDVVCHTEHTDTVIKTWTLEMIDTPVDRF